MRTRPVRLDGCRRERRSARTSFIVVEGGEGVGKSTQVRCSRRISGPEGTRSSSRSSPVTRPRGSSCERRSCTPTHPSIRATELLLMLADRAQHVAEVVRPALGARRDRRVRPLHAVDRSRTRESRAGLGVEEIERLSCMGDGRARARSRRRARPARRGGRGARVGRTRPLRAGRRRVPRRASAPPIGSWLRRGVGSSSTPPEPRPRSRPASTRRSPPPFRRLARMDSVVVVARSARSKRCAGPPNVRVTRTSSSGRAARESRTRHGSSRRC